MSLFDKIGDMARSAADKTNELLEVNRLNSRIATENARIGALKEKIGNHYWLKFQDDITLEPEIAQLCAEIKDLNSVVEQLSAQVAEIKNAGAADTEKTSAPSPSGAQNAQKFCPQCGTNLSADKKFCGTCGVKLG